MTDLALAEDGTADTLPDRPTAKPTFPLPPLVDLLTDVHGYPRLDSADQQPWRGDGADWVVFLPGHGKGNGETADVAVILPELVRALHSRLKPAVAGVVAERALLARTGMMSLPALVFLRGGTLLGSIPRVRDWSDYLQRITEILASDGASDEKGSA